MKNDKRKKAIISIVLLIAVLFVIGCGRGETAVDKTEETKMTEPQQTEPQEKETVTEPQKTEPQEEEVVTEPQQTEPQEEETATEPQQEEARPEATEQEQKPAEAEPETAVAEFAGLHPVVATEKHVVTGEFDSKDQVVAYAREKDDETYYLGRDNSEENVDFLKRNKGETDGVLYLGLPLYLPDKVRTGTAYVTVDDETVARVEGNELVGQKQGVFVLSSYNAQGKLLEEKKYVCTTFNDSKENKESLLTLGKDLSRFSNARDAEYWKNAVHTIMDMCLLLEARNFTYDFNGEPEFGYINNVGTAEERWTWTADPETIFEMSRGVCIQVAQLATYMLAGDYEDWGAILSEGNQGHIFNWFYEDGYYYIFDFTQVISDNAWNYYSSTTFRDYSKYVKKCKTIEEIREYCCNEKLSTEHNYAFYMYSCKGHDELPCNVNTGMSDSNAVLHNTWTESESIIIGFLDVVMEDLVVLYENENSTKIEWKSYTLEEINKSIPHGIYNLPVEYIYRYEY